MNHELIEIGKKNICSGIFTVIIVVYIMSQIGKKLYSAFVGLSMQDFRRKKTRIVQYTEVRGPCSIVNI